MKSSLEVVLKSVRNSVLRALLAIFGIFIGETFGLTAYGVPVANPADRKIGTDSFVSGGGSSGTAEVLRIAGSDSSCLNGDTGKGKMTQGFYEGMLVSYARSVCRPDTDPIKTTMMSGGNSGSNDGPATSGNPMDDTYMMLFSLGMWESGGCIDIGRDVTNGSSGTDQTAEAGCFQTSENIHQAAAQASPAMRQLEEYYQANSNLCDKDLFLKGASPKQDSYSSGSGWRELMKSCPALNAEHAAISVLYSPAHYGPVKNGKARKMTECQNVLQAVKAGVGSNPSLCSQLLPGQSQANPVMSGGAPSTGPTKASFVPPAPAPASPPKVRRAGRF